jgi:iron-sulfur cluster repair protein YtfE (RIC family)
MASRHDRTERMGGVMTCSGGGLIETDSTVKEIVARYPETLVVFNRFGLDSCCGGGIPVREAALRHGADLEGLLRSLRVAIGER